MVCKSMLAKDFPGGFIVSHGSFERAGECSEMVSFSSINNLSRESLVGILLPYSSVSGLASSFNSSCIGLIKRVIRLAKIRLTIIQSIMVNMVNVFSLRERKRQLVKPGKVAFRVSVSNMAYAIKNSFHFYYKPSDVFNPIKVFTVKQHRKASVLISDIYKSCLAFKSIIIHVVDVSFLTKFSTGKSL